MKKNILQWALGLVILTNSSYLIAEASDDSVSLLNFANGDRYEGNVKNGQKHGRGSYTWSNGDQYIGDYVLDQRTGQGTYIWKNKDRYEGEFVNGIRTGQGKLILSSGTSYEGEFLNDQWHGRGILNFQNGNQYEGTFEQGAQNGLGVFTWSNGDKYIGEFKKGQRHGRGEITKPDGTRFIGYYKNNTRDGIGISFNKEKPTQASEFQIWNNGNLDKYFAVKDQDICKLRLTNQEWVFLGEKCVDGWAHGFGNAVTKDGSLIILDKRFVLGHPVEGGIRPL